MRPGRRPRSRGTAAALALGGLLAAATAAAATAPPAAAAEDAGSGTRCDPGGLAPLLTPGRILLLGEIHGTREGPALVAAVACAALRRGLPVTVALEVPREEEERIARFLGSDGAADARSDLLAGDFWRRAYQDGRSSAAMLSLLARLRELRPPRGAPGRLEVTTLDEARRFASGQERDDHLASRLVAAVEAAGAGGLVVALTGNVHSRTTTGVPWDPAYRPAGTAVGARWPERTLPILLVNPPGTAWTCTGSTAASCGERPLGGGGDAGDAGRVELFAAPEDGHRGIFHLAALTASPPAVGEPAATAGEPPPAPG